ncbi:hypothetical protein AA106555_0503 [Neokomagataea thailandica NBRC 106555]|uniref:Accessory factor UbiK family protein n=2 Tax=Neokomagataea TaxID=1223423 RepID=A0A4Y6V3N4_9PROT|nr:MULTISPECIES: accessory factor UbiK family protein [Neokomagataea]QDH24553.1 accessory factor UbiK family protein [Neokomagataea tanensis]GBR51312.1 hypothetical protein AA106555_0503 [Neokomagataea thailandica NBRC 106555]
MSIKARFFDDIAGFAGNALSAASGLREEVHAIVRARVDEVLNGLDLVRRDEFEATQEMLNRARLAQEKAEQRFTALEERLARLEAVKAEHS